MQMLCALFSFIKMIKQQWASWARTQQRNKQGPGQALLFVNTNIHDNPPAVPRSCPAVLTCAGAGAGHAPLSGVGVRGFSRRPGADHRPLGRRIVFFPSAELWRQTCRRCLIMFGVCFNALDN